MHQSYVIEIDGNFVGAALTDGSKFQFVAADVRLADLDTSIWPTLAGLRSVVRRTLAGESIQPPQLALRPGAPPAIEAHSNRLRSHSTRGTGYDGRATHGLQRTVGSLRSSGHCPRLD